MFYGGPGALQNLLIPHFTALLESHTTPQTGEQSVADTRHCHTQSLDNQNYKIAFTCVGCGRGTPVLSAQVSLLGYCVFPVEDVPDTL